MFKIDVIKNAALSIFGRDKQARSVVGKDEQKESDWSPEIYSNTYVPLPSSLPRFSETDTFDDICRAVDDFFIDSISGYPEDTRKFIYDIYFDPEEKYIFGQKDYLKNRGGLATACVHQDESGNIFCGILIDEQIKKFPLMFRLEKIHELCHLGQIHQRIRKHGYSGYANDELHGFGRFTEYSAAAADKAIYDRLPIWALEYDLSFSQDLYVQQKLWNCISNILQTSFMAYTMLRHRPSDKDGDPNGEHTPEYQFFHNLPNVHKFSEMTGVFTQKNMFRNIGLPSFPSLYSKYFTGLYAPSPAAAKMLSEDLNDRYADKFITLVKGMDGEGACQIIRAAVSENEPLQVYVPVGNQIHISAMISKTLYRVLAKDLVKNHQPNNNFPVLSPIEPR